MNQHKLRRALRRNITQLKYTNTHNTTLLQTNSAAFHGKVKQSKSKCLRAHFKNIITEAQLYLNKYEFIMMFTKTFIGYL